MDCWKGNDCMKNLIEIILCGSSGRMGKEVSKVAFRRDDFAVVAGVDIVKSECRAYNTYEKIFDVPVDADVVVDFSNGACLESILEYGVQKNISLVLCSTGYTSQQIEKIKLTSSMIPIFYSRNVSLGINVLIEVVKVATKILKDHADVCIVEKHHATKQDKPSGTALMLTDAIRKFGKNDVDVHSVRAGTIAGYHDVIFACDDEVLTFSHIAASKEIFANGALDAARFIIEQSEGLYDKIY